MDLDAPADTLVYTLQASYPGDNYTIRYVVERDRSKLPDLTNHHWLHWGTNLKKKVVWDISPDSTLLGVTDT